MLKQKIKFRQRVRLRFLPSFDPFQLQHHGSHLDFFSDINHFVFFFLSREMETQPRQKIQELLKELTEEELLCKVEEGRIQTAKCLRRQDNMKRALNDCRFLELLKSNQAVSFSELPQDFKQAVSSLGQYGGQFCRSDYPESVWRLAEESAQELLSSFHDLVTAGELATTGMSHEYRIHRVRLKEMAHDGLPGHVQVQAKLLQDLIEGILRSAVARKKSHLYNNCAARGSSRGAHSRGRRGKSR